MILENNKDNTPHILKIKQWDAELPTGDWTGPDPLPLFPSLEKTNSLGETLLEFRELHIHYQPNSEQHPKIVEWVNNNIPNDLKWLFHGLDVNYVQFQKIFYAHPSVHTLQEGGDSKFRANHPEVFKKDRDTRVDTCRANFIQYLNEINCSFLFVTENEALDNGMLIIKDYERPRIIGSQDISPGIRTLPNKLWRYFTLTKFVNMLQNQTIWFSRPQFFEDPHEFTMDEPSQRELFQWKLDSFAREYNRAVASHRESFVIASRLMVSGLPMDKQGKIEKSLINLSDLSDTLLSSIRKDIHKWQESFCISCWRYSPYDSVAIWNQYATLKEGIAIVVDLDRIRKSFQNFGDIRLAVIDYRNFSDTSNSPMHSNPLGYKDVRYASEEEARFYFRAKSGDLKGVSVPFDLAGVVKEIHLSPNATSEFKGIVQDLLNKYNFNIPLVESSLCRVPSKY
ncbi:MAG: hypothetical protein ACI9XC_001640 [Gammaproteobacteria bacterium]|jgi:hypothetical protein